LGAKKIRLQSGWAKTEKQKGDYDFTWLDSIVNDAISRKIQPWIRYTRALVSHFRDRVNEWEIWNEADHRYNEAGPEQYAELYYRTGKAIREVQPNARLIGLSIAGVGRTAYVDLFFQYLQERDAVDLVDIATFHGYPRNPDDGFDAVKELKAVIYKYRPGVELWQGETGCPSTYGSSGALSGYHWTETIQAKWDLRRALAHVGRGYPFSLFTISEYTYDRRKFIGLNTKGILKVNDDLSIAYAKPAYYTYRNLTSLLDHRFERLPVLNYETDSDSSLSVFAFRHKVNTYPLIFIWMDGSIPAEDFPVIHSHFSFTGLPFSDPVVIDLMTGKVYELSDHAWSVNGMDTRFDRIPVCDAPVVLTDKAIIQTK